MPAYAPRRQPLPTQAERHPFMRWIGGLLADGDATAERSNDNYDFVIGDAAIKDFAIRAEAGGAFVLGVSAAVGAAITSIGWKTAALVRAHKGRDWVALAVPDARLRGAKEVNPAPIRLWIPAPAVVMEAFAATQPKLLRLREVGIVRGLPKETSRPPLMEIALSMKGRW